MKASKTSAQREGWNCLFPHHWNMFLSVTMTTRVDWACLSLWLSLKIAASQTGWVQGSENAGWEGISGISWLQYKPHQSEWHGMLPWSEVITWLHFMNQRDSHNPQHNGSITTKHILLTDDTDALHLSQWESKMNPVKTGIWTQPAYNWHWWTPLLRASPSPNTKSRWGCKRTPYPEQGLWDKAD